MVGPISHFGGDDDGEDVLVDIETAAWLAQKPLGTMRRHMRTVGAAAIDRDNHYRKMYRVTDAAALRAEPSEVPE